MRYELMSPTIDDFEVLRQAMLEVVEQPDTRARQLDERGQRLYFCLERLYADTDFLAWPPLTICLSGILSVYGGLHKKMTLRYRELTHNSTTINSSVNHDYVLEREGSVLVTYAHTAHGAPHLLEPRQDPRCSDEQLDMAEQGGRMLRQGVGRNMELTAGDCGVLFDRTMTLVGT